MKVFLHVSTAYVSSETDGLILEKQFKSVDSINGKTKADVNKEKELMEENLKQLKTTKATNKEIASFMKNLGIQRTKHHGWPNTYVFTKAMGEMLLGELRKDVPLVIKGTATCLRGDPDCIMDIVPVDMVVNAIIVAMAAHVDHPNSRIIYHVTSSASNPVKLQQIVDWSVEYLTKHPYINKDGSIKAHEFRLLTSETSFQKYIAIHYELPLKALKIANLVLCHALDGLYTDFSRKLQIGTLFSDLFKHYALSKAIYDDFNLKNLLNIYKRILMARHKYSSLNRVLLTGKTTI